VSKKNLNPEFVSPSDVSDLKHEINDETLLINNEINESVSGADGSFDDVLGGHEKSIISPEVDEFEYSRSLTRGTPDDDVIVKMRDVRVAFKIGSLERVIINHLNLDIKRGEILGLVGESGSGKTTIGRALMRINTVSGGEILFNNVKVSGKIPRKRERLLKTKLQMIFQDPGDSLNDRANIDYIVSEGLRAFHLYKDENERVEKVTNMMRKVGLRPEYLSRYPHEFSGGQRQRIGIARCMIMDPEFVVADEPISALDVSIRAQVLNLIKQFQQEKNMTVLFIAHDLSVVKYISDRIAVIYAGKIVELAEANRLFECPLHPYTKSLLTAVPIPDPKIERKKKIITYNPREFHHYVKSDAPELREIEPGHFVRCDTPEYNKYLEEVKKYSEGGNN
jgi:oligopeptide transport system ATP-binding protein